MLGIMSTTETIEPSRDLFDFQINRDPDGSDTEKDTPSPPAKIPTIDEEGSLVDQTVSSRQSLPNTSTPLSAGESPSRSRLLSPWGPFAVRHDSERRQTQLATPEPSSPLLNRDHFRAGTISDLANVSFQKPPPSSQAAGSSQSGSSQRMLNISFYGSATPAMSDGIEREDDEVSIPDTDAGGWGQPGRVEYADYEDSPDMGTRSVGRTQ